MNLELDLNLKFRIDDFDYTVFVSTDSMRCFGCGKTGHQIRACPISNANVNKPGPSGVQREVNHSKDKDVDKAASTDVEVGVNQEVAVEESRENNVVEEQSIEQLRSAENEPTESSEHLGSIPMSQMDDADSAVEYSNKEDNALLMEVDQNLFKTPLKRRLRSEHIVNKQARKSSARESETDQGAESESDSSDSAASACSQVQSWPCHDCSPEKIKIFLKATKNLRGVQVVDYFPNRKSFIEVTKSSMNEGFFLDKEVYRLKKFVTKVQNQLNDNET